ncbi:MspA family porin [Rhodococcus sp. NPDC047139]|uniref:MspA family porin n=1 Tax=Rhodococcus sp. NPDC047139 TaxID=3155141 RepID=UPI0033C938F1
MSELFSRKLIRGCARVASVGAVAVLAAAASHGTAAAAVDNSRILPLDDGRAIEVIQADTSTQSVPPLDSSPLSVEFFHDEVATVRITGPGAETSAGTAVEVGLQVGYPVFLPGATVTLYTPNLDWGVESGAALNIGIAPEFALELGLESGGALGGQIIPSQEIEIPLEPGGITDVPIVEDFTFDGASTTIRIAGVHGSVSGAVGPVMIRPYLKAVTADRDTVVTYGVPQRV